MEVQRKCLTLNSSTILNNLRSLNETLQSSIGCEGNFKILVTSGGYIDLTSSSETILTRLDIDCPLCLYIIQTALKLSDFGLYYTVAVTSFLVTVFKDNICEDANLRKVVSYVSEFKSSFYQSLTSPYLRHKAELSVGTVLLPLVKSVLESKSISKSINVNELAIQIIKGFIMSLNESQGKGGRVFTLINEGNDLYKAVSGIVYTLADLGGKDAEIIEKLRQKKIKLLIFTSMLTPSKAHGLRDLTRSLEGAIKGGVNFIACQKVVDEEIMFNLRRQSVFVIERMGEELTRSLQFVSSACPISHLVDFQVDDLSNITGELTRLCILESSERKYLLMENSKSPCSTIIVHTRLLGGLSGFKNVMEQTLTTLQLFGASPYLVPGNGCFEALLSSKIRGSTEKDKTTVTKYLLDALFSGAGVRSVKLDTTFSHLWSSNNKDQCNCGMVKVKDVLAEEFLEENDFSQCGVYLPSPFETSNYLFDCYETKVNAIGLVLDTIVSILDIGLLVYK